MRVLYSPQVNEKDTLSYIFEGQKITATYNGETDVFDFTDMPDGSANSYEREGGITSSLPIEPVIEAKKDKGVLSVLLLRLISHDATEEEKYPSWIEV